MSRKAWTSAVICMVYNSHEYISEFISYYLNICDHVYLIDHNSVNDLRGLNEKNVTVVRSNQEAQFQSECTNIVIEHYGIKQNYDWLFVLDIDEFLPFRDRSEFQTFLEKHKQDKVLQLHWRNGVPFHDYSKDLPHSLIDCNDIRFFSKRGQQHKSFVNIRKTKGHFFVPTGSHYISGNQWWVRKDYPIVSRRKNYKPFICDKPLYHVVAYNKNHFIAKIKNYVHQMSYREHIVGQGGWSVREYPEDYTDEEWLWYIANFRSSNPDDHYKVRIEDFVAEGIFDHLDRDEVLERYKKIGTLSVTEKNPANNNEKAYLEYKHDDRKVLENIEWFQIDENNEIQIVPPKG